MLTRDKKRLDIFENFVIDRNLPKYKATGGDLAVNSNDGNWTAVGTVGGSFKDQSFGTVEDGNGDMMQLYATKKDSFGEWIGRKFRRLGNKLAGYENKTPNEEGKIPTITVEEFFKSIKNSKVELNKIDKRLEGYEASMKQSKELGQVALTEQLAEQIEVIRSESQLFAKNMVTVVTEDQIIKFYKECEKGLRLDWIKNFTRQIPSIFINVKKELDDLKVFDNYVILHYDPNAKAFAETKKEIEKKKDPILFGVLKNSTKLYYIGDWTDEVCDLTLDDLMDKYGKAAIHQNNIKAKIEV